MTTRVALADFGLPFQARQYPDYQRAAGDHMERLSDRGLLPTAAARQRYEAQQFPLMCAYAFPDATVDGFAVALDLCAALAMIDNVLEAAPPEAQEQIAAVLRAMLNGGAAPSAAASAPAPLQPVLALVAETWATAVDARGPAWAASTADAVMAWVAAEIRATATEGFATVDAYRALRARTVAVDMFVRIAEAANGIAAPEWIWQHPDAVQMRRFGADLVGAINDVISADTDAAAGAANLITVLQTLDGMDRAKAERHARQLINEDAQAFARAAEAVAAHYPVGSTDAERQGSDLHIDTFRNLAVATDQWGRRSARYAH